MIIQTISNLYILGISKDIYIKRHNTEINWDSSSEDSENDDASDYEIHYEIIDGSKRNLPYKKLIEIL